MDNAAVKVLLIEDDEDDYLITRDLLSEIAQPTIDLEWVNSAARGREAIRDGRYKLILLDYRLGEQTGLEILRDAVAAGCTTPIILLTGQGDHEVDVEAMKAGAADYLIKGKIDAALLERAMRYAIERSQTLAMREKQLAAEASNRARSEFLAIISHELRSPLAVVLGCIDLLFDAELPPDQRELLEPIRRSGNHLKSLVKDILEFSKLEAGKLAIEHVPCSPRALVAEVVAMVQANAAEAGVDVAVGAAEELPETIQTDPTRLRQILLNLVGNAIKFAGRGAVRLSMSMACADDCEAARICFEVQDTGVGLTEEQIGRLFEPFSQVDGSATRRLRGTGLGLTISQRLARLLGGDISVKSEPGAGSTFTLTIATELLHHAAA